MWKVYEHTLIKVILIPPGQSCSVFVYFENLWEVNTPCAQRLRQTTGVWYQAELKLCQHIQSARLTSQRPTVISYLRHRHTVNYNTWYSSVPHVQSLNIFLCWHLYEFWNISSVTKRLSCLQQTKIRKYWHISFIDGIKLKVSYLNSKLQQWL